MGKLISTFFISLDGVVEAPETWHMSYFNDEMGEIIGAGMAQNKAFLFGRAGYDGGAAYWPTSTDEYADYFNKIRKYVISSSLQDPTWNNTVVVPGDAAAVQQVKDDTDGVICMNGSAITTRWLLAEGLIDELWLLLHPVTVGQGQRLFEGDAPAHRLELAESKALSTGVTFLKYRPTR
ncbi:dihydrofolate reductase family protein [Microlunatus speluncae]|uniref:dihydrofolate reductase family protein n=1 Tax=Microlunatus speluncae TaxID=2594267 RepID=UPI001266442B|nr:dihydrofolate reductase family protein [Microlunatus speluncae]